MNFQAIKSIVTIGAGRSALILRKHSPEILMASGVVGIIASAVMACKATLKVNDILDEASEKVTNINHSAEVLPDKYSAADAKKDLAVLKVQTGVSLVKLYAPSVIIGAASIGCVLGAHVIMRKRNIAIIAAYKAIDESFNNYRKRIVDEFGADKDRLLKNGITRTASEKVINEDGTVSATVTETVDPNGISQYARFFDEYSTQWSKTPEYNLTYLKLQQNFANDLLRSRGHVFLNEIYDMIGVPRSQAGAVVGWVRGQGDDFVDFGLFDGNSPRVRDFVNGHECSILLDFNVSGVIYDMI